MKTKTQKSDKKQIAAKKAKQKRESVWTNYRNPLPTTEKEREMWSRFMHEDSNRTLLPKYRRDSSDTSCVDRAISKRKKRK